MMDMDEPPKEELFLHTKTRTELESDLERCLERKRNLEEERSALHNLKIDFETMLNQRQEELSQARAQLASLQSEREDLKVELGELKQMRLREKDKVEELTKKILQVEQEKVGLQEENERLNQKVEQIVHDREAYRAYSEEAEKLVEIKTGKLMADLREVQEVNQRYQTEIGDARRKITEYEEKIREAMGEKEAVERKMQTQRGVHEFREEFLTELGDKLEDLQNLVTKFGSELQAPRLVLEGEERKSPEKDEVETLLAEPEKIGVESEVEHVIEVEKVLPSERGAVEEHGEVEEKLVGGTQGEKLWEEPEVEREEEELVKKEEIEERELMGREEIEERELMGREEIEERELMGREEIEERELMGREEIEEREFVEREPERERAEERIEEKTEEKLAREPEMKEEKRKFPWEEEDESPTWGF